MSSDFCYLFHKFRDRCSSDTYSGRGSKPLNSMFRIIRTFRRKAYTRFTNTQWPNLPFYLCNDEPVCVRAANRQDTLAFVPPASSKRIDTGTAREFTNSLGHLAAQLLHISERQELPSRWLRRVEADAGYASGVNNNDIVRFQSLRACRVQSPASALSR